MTMFYPVHRDMFATMYTDTLYKVSLVSDDANSSLSQSSQGGNTKPPLSSKSFASWGTSLLRGKKESSLNTLMSSTGPQKVVSDVEMRRTSVSDDIDSADTHVVVDTTVNGGVNDGGTGENDNHTGSGENEVPNETEKSNASILKSRRFNEIALLVSTPGFTFRALFENSIQYCIIFAGEPLYLLDSTHGICPPQLKVTQHGLTVRNTTNKKWSTVRSTTRLTSGVHQWEVYIDRCISKNIFIGVVGPEARTDNYVGCDKNGWAFLANRAVWFNKGKLKSYGELFRTGDVVQVTLDLEVGGSLSFSINGKDLGVAVEDLTGPLYPAFSLYNEDDQISLCPPRQPLFYCADDDSSKNSKIEAALAKMAYDVDDFTEGRRGHCGTANAERALQRLTHFIFSILLH